MDAAAIIWNAVRKNELTTYKTVFKNSYNDRAIFAIMLFLKPDENETDAIWMYYDFKNANSWYLFYRIFLPLYIPPEEVKIKMVKLQQLKGVKTNYKTLPERYDYQTLLNLRESGYSLKHQSVRESFERTEFDDRPYTLDLLRDLHGNTRSFWEQAVFLFPDYIIAALIPPELAFLGILVQNKVNDFDNLAILNFMMWVKTGNSFYHSFIPKMISDRYGGTTTPLNAETIQKNLKNPNLFMNAIISYLKRRKEDDIERERTKPRTFTFYPKSAEELAINQLNLKPPIDCENIRKAYRKKSLIDHPDKGGTAQEFIKTKNSYELLNKRYNC